MMVENIVGYPGYHVTRDGKVYSLKGKNGPKLKKPHIHHNNGREIVSLMSNHKRFNVKISRLVAMVYIPNPENKPCVCHKDNNKLNNRVENLYWGTHKENSEQMVVDKRSIKGRKRSDFPNRKYEKIHGLKGLDNPRFKLSVDQFNYLKDNLGTMSWKEKLSLAKEWGISRRCIDRYISNIKSDYYATSGKRIKRKTS